MGLYEIGLVGMALFGAVGGLALISMLTEAGSWRVFFGFAIITGLFAGLAHLTGPEGLQTKDVIPALSQAVAMVRGPAEP